MTRVILHIGAPKTGTSFVQSVLSNNQPVLADRGLLWPGSAWAQQVRAVEDLRESAASGNARAPRWDDMVDEIRTFPGSTAIISMEWLCLGGGPMAERAIDSLRGLDVHAVMTLRDLIRTIPAQWQEATQNGFGWTYPDFVEALSSRRPQKKHAGEHFWKNQDWGRMAHTWAPLVGKDRFWVVTVPPPGSPPEVLWDRFCLAAGVDPSGYSLDGWHNESLGAASAELMRRLQLIRQMEAPNPKHRGRLKHRLAKQTLARHRQAEPRLGLPPERYDWAIEATRRLMDRVEEFQPRLIGDLGDLFPPRPVRTEGVVTDPAALGDSEVLDAAMFALFELTRPRS